MDLSALIFVALAVAWVVYLVPKALRHHEEDAVSRSVDRFSDRLRVLARRDAVSASEAELVRSDAPAPPAPLAEPVEATTKQPAAAPSAEPVEAAPRAVRSPVARRAAARRAAQRRRRVLGVLVLLTLVVAGLAVGSVVATPWIAAPLTLLAAWLVACRLMVRNERAARAAVLAPARRRRRTLADEEIASEDAAADTAPEPDLPAEPGGVVAELADDDTGEIPAVTAEVADNDGWTPVAVPLPTYVAKAPAGRTVRTIDLDATGVWSSGRNEADSQLAREADAQRSAASAESAADADERRATGS